MESKPVPGSKEPRSLLAKARSLFTHSSAVFLFELQGVARRKFLLLHGEVGVFEVKGYLSAHGAYSASLIVFRFGGELIFVRKNVKIKNQDFSHCNLIHIKPDPNKLKLCVKYALLLLIASIIINLLRVRKELERNRCPFTIFGHMAASDWGGICLC